MLTTSRPEDIDELEAWPTVPEKIRYKFKESTDTLQFDKETGAPEEFYYVC